MLWARLLAYLTGPDIDVKPSIDGVNSAPHSYLL